MTDTPTANVLKESKKLPLIIAWGQKNIDLGEIAFLRSNSLVFKSSFFGSQNAGEQISFGFSDFKDDKFNNRPADTFATIDRGFHITLHTPEDEKPGVMNFTTNDQGSPLYRRELDWFPVKAAFNLVRGFTLPMDVCKYTSKKSTLLTGIDLTYLDSLELVVDVFPLDVKEYNPYESCIEVWGNCPEYKVRVSIILARQRKEAFIYWPDDSVLTL